MVPIIFDELNPENEVVWANGRMTDGVYAYRSFIAGFGRDAGYPARYVYKVFGEREDLDADDNWEWTE